MFGERVSVKRLSSDGHGALCVGEAFGWLFP